MARGRPLGSKAAVTPKGRQSPASRLSSRSSSPIVAEAFVSKTRTTRASRLRAIEIPDSDTLDEIVVASNIQESSFTKTPAALKLKEVAVPKHSSKVPVTRGHRAVASSSISSLDDTMDDTTSEYETPGTSVVVTPAEVSLALSTSGKKVSATARAIALRTSSQGLNGRNTSKKRRAQDMAADGFPDIGTDAQLAQRLQAEEYEELDSVDAGTSKRTKISNSSRRLPRRETDSPSLSDVVIVDSDSDDDIPLSSVRGGRGALPSRAARDSAKKSISTKLATIVPDSEDDESSSLEDLEDVDDESELSDTFTMDSDAESGSAESLESDASGADAQHGPSLGGSASRAQASRARPRRIMPRRFRGFNPNRHLSRTERERRKLETRHPEIKTMWDDLKDIEPIKPVPAQQPIGLSRTLKSFQLEGLNWMIRQEQSQWKGGLLGDEMGMGKTIQAVSLIMSDYPAKNPSLVCVPPVALMQWQEEIKIYTDGKLKVLVYHNTNPKVRNLKVKDLKAYDVIMISYSGLESMYRKETKGWNRDGGIVKEDSIIHAIHYHRLILDEAHSIKTRTTSVARACFALKGDYKWCLSGTPVQNRIGEFFSLLRFLEIRPFASYFCKECDCNELHWSQNEEKRCNHCKHTGFNHVSVFNQELLNPITQAEDPSLRKEALGKLRLITDRIMLRRLKRDHTASMELPPKEVVIHNEFFGEIERDFSSSIMTNTNRQFDTYVSRGVMLNNYANIFGLIMQMRQVANHPDLILKKHGEGGQNVLVCCICDEPAEEAIRSKCHHEFCRQCAKNYVRSVEEDATPDCPRCHIPLSIDFDQPDIEQEEENVKKNSIINRIKMEDWTSSTKIEMLIYDLYKLRSKKQTHKSIVFSQFTSMLQLVEWRLRRAGFNTVMLDGSMSPTQRQKSIEHFMNNVDCEVFLVSLKAGGVALNLTEASRVYIVDPWWNPAAEWQSADRCHRIGQRRPCVITRLCIEDSVESRMVLLQEKKANMINGTINNDQVAMDKLTPEDMQFLFRGT